MYSIVVGAFAVQRFPTFCAALVGGYTFLKLPLHLLFDRAFREVSSKRNRAASRFFAAIISAWFSFDILNDEPVYRKNVQQVTPKSNCSGSPLHKIKNEADYCQTSPPIWAGKTMDLTLLAVTRALDTLVINSYRWYYSTTVFSRYADTFVFALSSSTVVRLQSGMITSYSSTQLDLQEHLRVSQVLTARLEDVDLVLPLRSPVQGLR